MKLGFNKRLSPAERFVSYFEQAKFNYESSNDIKNATQKSILEWYNKKYNASLSEASLSKYLRGTNEIPIDVYVNMKELAGIEDLFYGMGASRKDFEISSDFKESLGFVSDEIEFMCGLEELEGTEGESIKEMMKILEKYCECASRKDYRLEIETLQELKDIISKSEDKIRCAIEKNCNSASPYDTFNLVKGCVGSAKINNHSDGEYFDGYCMYNHEWYSTPVEESNRDCKLETIPKWENGKFDEDEGSPRTLSYNQEITLQEKDNRESKPSSNNILELEIRKERFDKLAHLVNRCIYLHRKLTLTEDIYMDIPVKEECEILRSIKRNA